MIFPEVTNSAKDPISNAQMIILKLVVFLIIHDLMRLKKMQNKQSSRIKYFLSLSD